MVTIRSFNFLLTTKSLVLPPVAIEPPPGGADHEKHIRYQPGFEPARRQRLRPAEQQPATAARRGERQSARGPAAGSPCRRRWRRAPAGTAAQRLKPAVQRTASIHNGSVSAASTVERNTAELTLRVSSGVLAKARILTPLGQAASSTSTLRAASFSPGNWPLNHQTMAGNSSSLANASPSTVRLGRRR